MKYVLKQIDTIRFYDPATDEHRVTLDDLKTVTMTNGQETVYADGKNGVHLAAWDNNKTTTVTAENGSIESGYIAMAVGSEDKVVSNGKSILVREELTTADGSTAIMAHKASGTAGNELKFIYAANDNGLPGESYAQGSAASETEFKYEATTKTITLPTGKFKAGDKVFVDYYPTFKQYREIVNDANKFSMTGSVWLDCWMRDICTQKDTPMFIHMPSAKVSGNLEMTFGDQAAVMNVEVEAVASACGSDKRLWTLYNADMEEIDDQGE